MFFILALSRAAVEGPSLNRDQVWVAPLHSEDRGHQPPSAQAKSEQLPRSAHDSRRFPRLLDKRLGPSTSPSTSSGSAQDGGMFPAEVLR